MREILFRGKRKDNGEWVEGCLLEQDNPEYHAYIVKSFKAEMDNRCMDILECDMEEVDPATVGQYTGLKDKNGKRIFEGDIVDLECDADLNELWVFEFGNCGGVQNVVHEVGYMGFYLRPISDNAIHARDYGQRDDPVYYLNAFRLRTIGNIHDNPEMLNGGADNA